MIADQLRLQQMAGTGGLQPPPRGSKPHSLMQLAYVPTVARTVRLELTEAGFGGLPAPCAIPMLCE